MNAPEHGQPSILVVLMGSLGDVVRGFAVLRPLKEQLPGCRITWLIESKWADLARVQRAIDEVLLFERERGVRAAIEVLHGLQRRRFDIVLDMQRLLKSGLCSRASGAPRRIGFHPHDAKEFNHLFNNEYVPRCPPDFPKVYHYMKFVEQLGVAWSEPLDFGFDALDREPAPDGMPASPYVTLVMGSSRKDKDWTAGGYRELARMVIEELRLGVVLVGDRSQCALAAQLFADLRSPQVVDLTGATTLRELAVLLRGAHAAAGPDSGPGHIAAAVGTPYVALFGPTNVPRVAPYRCEHLVVRAESGMVADIPAAAVFERLAGVIR